MSQRKVRFPATYKMLDASKGIFEAIVSVFGNVDLIGDRVVKGAFAASIKKWTDSGDPIPVIWSHQWDDITAHIGEVLEVEERDVGLYVKAQLDMEEMEPRRVAKLLNRRRVKEFSFAYDVVREKRADDGANDLLELDIIEVGPTLKGMNPATELLAVKSMGEKAWVAVEGSFEQLQQNLAAALKAWATENYGSAYAWLEATFAAQVIACVETYTETDYEMTYYRMSYTADGATFTFGKPTEVAIAGRVSTKDSAPDAAKDAEAKTEEPEGAKAEEPKASGFAMQLDAERQALELLALQ